MSNVIAGFSMSLDGSAAFADVDTGVTAAVMRNHFSLGDFTLAEGVDNLVVSHFRRNRT